jgi:exosome complex RNA-binding protein Rrp42 (RNase PH superfamily)
LISDPSADEESMLGCTTSVCYSTNAAGELQLCGIHKLGGAQNLSAERLREVTRLASEQAQSFRPSNSQKKASAAFASPPPAVRA